MPRIVAAVLLAALAASATPGAATSQADAFTAVIEDKLRRPEGACPNGAFRCGEAQVEEFGPADWEFFLESFVPAGESCGNYTATVVFTLTDGSELILDEAGTVCGPGKSFFATPGFSWGNPDEAIGEWQVQSGTGQFAGVAAGNGTNRSQSAGAAVRGIYIGLLSTALSI